MDDSENARIRAEAEDWFARLHAPDCTPEQRRRFLHWREWPEHAQAYARTEKLWSELGAVAAVPRIQALSRRLMAPPRPRARMRRGAAWAVAATVFLGVAIVGGKLMLPSGPAPVQTHVTAIGEVRSVVLEDGSRLTLNTDSVVTVSVQPQIRRLEVQRGEALFDVRRDPARPFVVTAGDGEVRALGTRFQVYREPGQVTVTLLQGGVVVERDGSHELLSPGERMRYGERGTVERMQVDPDLVSSWTRGRLIFRSAPLMEVLVEVNRYARPVIRVDDPQLARRLISGSVTVGDSSLMASALSRLLVARTQKQKDGSVLLLPEGHGGDPSNDGRYIHPLNNSL